jgi:phage tail tape-measure protein
MFLAVFVALAAMLLFFGVAVYRYRTGTEVGAALGVITGTVGTILGGFLGVQAGASGKREAEEARRDAEMARQAAEERATALAAALEPDKAVYVLNTVGRPNGLASMS